MLPSRQQLTSDHEPACMCHLYRLRIKTHVLTYTMLCLIARQMTPGLKCSSQKFKKLYKSCLKQNSTPNTCETYVLYRNCLNKVKRYCKAQHYKNSCESYKNNTKKLWEIINQCVGKTNNKNCIINSIRTQKVILTDPTEIANELCNHYSRVGAKLSSTIPSPTTDEMVYVKKIIRH